MSRRFLPSRAARLGAAAGLVALAAGAVVQASAAATGGATTVTFTNPTSSGQTMSTGPVVLAGTVTRPGGDVDSVQVLVHWIDTVQGRPKIAHPDQQTVATAQGQVSTFNWTFPLGPAANGQYSVTVTATTDDATPAKQTEQNIAQSIFTLDVPPVAPTGVVPTVSKTARTVSLKWTANPEPDLIGYAIYRSDPSSPGTFAFVNGVYAPATTYTDTTVSSKPPGTYRYVLVAVRPGAQGGTDHLKYSTRSDVAEAPLSSPPVTPTTAVTSSGGSSGGATGGSPGTIAGIQQTNAVPILPPGNGLSDYQSLVNEANATTATTEPPDTGYSNNLPYQPKTSTQAIGVPSPADGLGANDSGSSSHQSAEFIAGALLLAVIAGFVFLIKRAVDQPLLEATVPDEVLGSLFTPVADAGAPRPLRSEFRHQ